MKTCEVCTRQIGPEVKPLGHELSQTICRSCWDAIWRAGGWKCPRTQDDAREVLKDVFGEQPVGDADVVEFVKGVRPLLSRNAYLERLGERIESQMG